MALSSRELTLVLNARDQMGGVLTSTQKKIGLLGVGLAAVGVAGISAFNEMADAAIEYNRQTALTSTQVREAGVTISDLGDIGKRVAKEIPAPFDEMQAALYDIFSSVDVNVRDAERLLALFAKGAVAGQTDIQTAARSSIGIMNAYGLEVSDLSRVMDIMFELVRSGVGTYEEFNSSIGQATPTFANAGQTIETLAGAMAFLTRGGLDTGEAVAAAGRAVEQLFKPNVIKNLKGIGVDVVDASGNFRQLNDIITDLAVNAGWATMSDAKRGEAFKKIFGQGTIQARRFFDTAIPNWQTFNDLTARMSNSSGALSDAYDIMFAQPASQAQLLQNRLDILKVEIGEQLIPAKLKLAEAAKKVLDWWDKLSPKTQTLLVKIAALGSVLAVVTGTALVLSVAIAALSLPVLLAVAAFAAVVAAGYLVYRNWSTIKAVALEVWATLRDWASWLAGVFVSAWQAVVGVFQAGFAWFDRTLAPGLSKVWHALSEAWSGVSSEIGETLSDLLSYWNRAWGIFDTPVRYAFNAIVEFLGPAWAIITTIVLTAVDLLSLTIGNFLTFVQNLWSIAWQYVTSVLSAAWRFISDTVANFITTVSNLIQFFLNVLQGDWGEAWQNVKNILGAAWNQMLATARLIGGLVVAFIRGMKDLIVNIFTSAASWLYGAGKAILQGLWDGAKAIYASLADWLSLVPAKVKNFFAGAVNWLYSAGKNILTGLLNGFKAAWQSAADFLSGLGSKIVDLKGPPAKDKVLLLKNGQYIMRGLKTGLEDGWRDVESFLAMASERTRMGIPEINAGGFTGAQFPALSTVSQTNAPPQGRGAQFVFNAPVTFGSDLHDATAELDWWSRTKVSGV